MPTLTTICPLDLSRAGAPAPVSPPRECRGLRIVYGLYTIPRMAGINAGSRSERVTVAEEVYRALKRDIITLRHAPGASLPEQELATA